MNDVLASVIVLTWNSRANLSPCLDALLSQDYSRFEVIVVDNGSQDGSADLVAQHYPQVRLIRNEANLGFAGGNNAGMNASTGDVLVLLNDDTEVHPGWLAALVGALVADRGIGIAGARALYPDGSVQHAGGEVDVRGQGRHRGADQAADDPDYVTGNSLAISRQALTDIGQLDEGFFPIYYEDVDWCYRARKAGYRVVYAPEAVLTHKEASRVASPDHEGMYVQQRNRIRFVLKHWSLPLLEGGFLDAERAWLEGLGEGGERLVAATHHAYLYHLLHLADLAKWRPAGELGAAAHVLLALRATSPLSPAKFSWSGEESAPVLAAGELRKRTPIREVPFRSHVPLLGPVIAAIRDRWNRISTQWYVRPLVQQQNEFNAWVIHILERLAEVTATYQQENGREVAELAREIQQLKVHLGEYEKRAQGGADSRGPRTDGGTLHSSEGER